MTAAALLERVWVEAPDFLTQLAITVVDMIGQLLKCSLDDGFNLILGCGMIKNFRRLPLSGVINQIIAS